jgi:hypothetical protein
MGILSLSGDRLKYDPLKEDQLKYEFDPYSAEAGKRVRTYDKELGYAVHPEEKAYAKAYNGYIDKQAQEQQSAIDAYKANNAVAMSKADKEASGILASVKGQVAGIKKQTVPTIPINVVSSDGKTIEGTYKLPKSVAEEMAKEKELVTKWGDDGSFNVSVRTKHGYIRGEELHKEFGDAVNTINSYNEIYADNYDAAKKAGEMQFDSVQKQIASDRKIALDAYNQNVSQANQTLNQIKGKWTGYVSQQRKAFQSGIKSNAGGISDLVNSGALVFSGSKKQ